MRKLKNALAVYRIKTPVTIGIKDLSPGDFIAVRLHESESINQNDMSASHDIFLIHFGGALKISCEAVLPYFSKLEKVTANAA